MRTLYYNGRLFTADPKNRWASAMLVDGTTIAWVGTDPLSAPAASGVLAENRVDLRGRFVTPGFIDSHMHLAGYGKLLGEASLAEHTDSLEHMCQAVKRYVEDNQIPEGAWVCGRGWNQDSFQGERRYPNRRDLDGISERHPIFLTRACGHLAVANTRAMELAGIREGAGQPKGGRILMDEDGTPSGIFQENAINLLTNAMPRASLARVKEYMRAACKALNRFGITSVHSDDFLSLPRVGYETILEAYRQLEREGQLTVKVYEQSQFEDLGQLREFVERGYRTGAGTDYVKIGPLKLIGDGSLGSRTALLSRPYADDPSSCGIGVLTPGQLEEMISYGHGHGMQIAVHAIGDGMMEQVVSAYEKALGQCPRADHRHGIVHSQITTRELLKKFHELSLHAYVQSIFLDYDSKIVESRVGGERASWTYQFKTLFDMAGKLSNGSDCPVETPDVMKGIQCAVTRTSLDGSRTFLPGQALTLEEALDSYTALGAWASFEEEKKGMLRAGMAADFAVLDRDISQTPSWEVGKARVEETFLDGARVWGEIGIGRDPKRKRGIER